MSEITKDKSTESVEKVLMKYFGHYGLPYKIISNGQVVSVGGTKYFAEDSI